MSTVALVVGLINGITVILVAVTVMTQARRHHRQSDEITELQAAVDMLMITHDYPSMFAERYGVEIVPKDEADP